MENSSVIQALKESVAFGFLDRRAPYSEEIFNPALIWNSDELSMLQAISGELKHAQRFTFSVAFLTSSALAMLKQVLLDFDGEGTFITSTYLGFNEPKVFEELLNLSQNNKKFRVFVHDDSDIGFHAKGYIFYRKDSVTAIVGSSNLTDRALTVNHEWNLKFSAAPDGHIVDELEEVVKRQQSEAIELNYPWIRDYELRRKNAKIVVLPDADNTVLLDGKIVPNDMQAEALERLRVIYDDGAQRALIISATGTGKTILAALAVRQAKPKRMLFIVHREQILAKACQEFQRVLGGDDAEYGLFAGGKRDINARYVFATIQSLAREETLRNIDHRAFDFIVIDEVHRAAADSYTRVIDHFEPNLLLGLTATPERTDGFNIFELFDHNIAYEIRLKAALEAKMLVPFHYYGVTDYVDANNTTVDETASLGKLLLPERVKYIVEMLECYGFTRDVKGLMFCSRNEEAAELSRILNTKTVHGKCLRTKALSGNTPIEERERAVEQLERGELDYLLTVDIFNEGIDIPAVNQVVLLRNTQSAIVFTQQLGRGLRKNAGKDHLRVIDFIGDYKNNYLIPVALFGNHSRDKDSIRRSIRTGGTGKTISGLSSISFDEISQQRILDSLAQVTIDSLGQLKADISLLFNRLGRIPKLKDFLESDTADPVLLANKDNRNYWDLLHKAKFVDAGPSDAQRKFLNFLSSELLPGKRPHELLLLRELINRRSLSETEFIRVLIDEEVSGTTDATLSSVERVLSFEFYKKGRFGEHGLIVRDGDRYRIGPDFARELQDQTFSAHVHDVIETGELIARTRESWSAEMKVGNMYSRREVCRMLNFESNQESTVYGYKVDQVSMTCPIFVTYHKADDIAGSVNYEDQFIDVQTMSWFTRSKRTLASAEVRRILSREYDMRLFVKKDDAEGNNFYYLGKVAPSNEEQRTMVNDRNEQIPVVAMDLRLESPVDLQLYDYLNMSATTVDFTSSSVI
ncbi:DEAD/DEAH box helicase [Arcanobacterium bovis]|uniref:DUF3427 domain-containing protein n=1 Tax=Arcanobacterium bovis TaxID=2529275 RepID=A0A4Q9V410_9ACTO|nr:DEAD/DEAH box helicase [Arcanobacterium bovis]TBW23727.1 DUF3427 domain-containing protein [Arcanobacterium bovis]